MRLKKFIQKQMRRSHRVYIVPTKMGGYLIGLIFLMFLLSVGYSNNLLLIFTLFLFGFNLLWVVQTHFHLQKLRPSSFSLPHGHTGESLALKIHWEKAPQGPWRWTVTLVGENEDVSTVIFEDTESFSAGEFELSKRGLWKWTHLKVSTSMPYGLYHVWIYFRLNQETLSYPRLLSKGKIPSYQGLNKDGDIPQEKPGPHDIRNLAPYQGEEFRKISWKHYARSGEILVKEGEELSSPLWQHALILPADPEQKERYLSEVATQMVYCFQHQIPFVLTTKEKKYGPSLDEVHLHQCLKVLSLC